MAQFHFRICIKKYGKVKEGVTRDIIVLSNMTLHALHYLIQRAFGWQNEHLHHFELPERCFEGLTGGKFMGWADFCGLYFRFPTDDYDDLCWDDDYLEFENFKTWIRSKYTGNYKFLGISEGFLETKKTLMDFIDKHATMRVSAPFDEWMKLSEKERNELRTHPRIKKLEDVNVHELRSYYMDSCGPEELLERLTLNELLGDRVKDEDLMKLIDVAEAKFGENKDDFEVLPLSKKLIYKYDYGDDWEVEIELLDKYYGETSWTKPICLELDGLPVLDDVGGVYGYCEMLGAIYVIPSEHFDYKDPEETKEWAAMQGWTGKMVKAENLI